MLHFKPNKAQQINTGQEAAGNWEFFYIIMSRDQIALVILHKYTGSRVEGSAPVNTDNLVTITKAMPDRTVLLGIII